MIVAEKRSMNQDNIRLAHRKSIRSRAIRYRWIYVFILPAFVWYLVFCYIPMFGILMAFQDFNYSLGYFGSKFVGFRYFKSFLTDTSRFWPIMRNTISISLLKLIFCFPAPILLALSMNAVTNTRFKRVVQSLSYLPHFVTWVVVVALLNKFLSPNPGGVVNDIRAAMGLDRIYFMGEVDWFYPLVILSDMWKGMGWGSIVYLAAITNIDPTLYEAAEIDGASSFQMTTRITIPSIMPTIGILLIYALSGVLNVGFEQILLMKNPSNASVSEIIDTYVLQKGIKEGLFSYATAINLFKSVISIALIIAVNTIVRRMSDNEISLW